MKKWQKEVIGSLYEFTNDVGSVSDLTAIGTKRLTACAKANQQVSLIIAAAFFEQNKDKTEQLLRELELLTHWNFPDKNGRMSDEEKQLNDRYEKIAKENNLRFFFNR